MAKLRLMTHNQWKCDKNLPDWEAQGLDCSPTVRMHGFTQYYKETLPDMVGIQEISGIMADKLIRYLHREGMDYALLWGRDTPILYRPDKFEVVDSYFDVYPEAFEGYEGSFNNGMTKSFCIGVFRVKESGNLFLYCSTHLWWMADSRQAGSSEARAYQLGLAIEKVDEYQKKYHCPAVIVGDLNAGYNSPAVQYALSHGFAHAHDIAVEYADDTRGYHRCDPKGFEPMVPGPFVAAIDHILVRGANENFVRRFDRYTPDYYLPLSDHTPAWIDVEI